MKAQQALEAVRAALGPDLLRADWRRLRPAGAPPSWGCCYVASEALRALADELLTPCTLRTALGVHWFLLDAQGRVWDPTADQFDGPLDYSAGRGRGFLTREPSRRARALLDRIREA